MILLLLNYELLNIDACTFIITFTYLLNIFNKTFYSHCAALVMNLTSLINFILYLVSEMPFNILSVELYCSVVCVFVGQCLRFLDVDLQTYFVSSFGCLNELHLCSFKAAFQKSYVIGEVKVMYSCCYLLHQLRMFFRNFVVVFIIARIIADG